MSMRVSLIFEVLQLKIPKLIDKDRNTTKAVRMTYCGDGCLYVKRMDTEIRLCF